MSIRHLLWMAMFALSLFPLPVWTNDDAKRLYEELLMKNQYSRLIRPVGETNATLTVNLGLKLSQLVDVVSLQIAEVIVNYIAFLL